MILIISLFFTIVTCVSDGLTSTKPAASVNYGRFLADCRKLYTLLDSFKVFNIVSPKTLKTAVHKYSKEKAFGLIQREFKHLHLKSFTKKEFNAEYRRLTTIVPKKRRLFYKKYFFGGDWKNFLTRELRDYVYKYHGFDIATKPYLLGSVMNNMRHNAHSYIKYFTYGN